MAEFRHAAIFFLPAIALALGMFSIQRSSPTKFALGKFTAYSIVWGTLLLLSWMTLNTARNGSPLKPSNAQMECVQYLAAYNPIPYCDKIPSNTLCTMDPSRQFINNPAAEPNALAYNKPSPIVLVADADKLCVIWDEVKKTIISEYGSQAAKLIGLRFIYQFGAWTSSERGVGLYPVQINELNTEFDDLLVKVNGTWYITAAAFLLVLISFFFGNRVLWPLLTFLVIGALGHAFGITLNNPFTALRYLQIHKSLIILAGMLCVPLIVKAIVHKRVGN